MSILRHARSNFGSNSVVILILLSAAAGVAAAVLFSWSLAALLTIALIATIALPGLLSSMEARLASFFALYAVSEFLKKATFLIDGQDTWSQFIVFLLPFGFFLAAVLIPWTRQIRWRNLTTLQWLVFGFVVVATANTWLSENTSLVAKASATALLVAPWLMIAVASEYPYSIKPVAKVLIAFGLLSALYGVIQFIFGPTPVELRWVEQTGRLSIGATHLLEVLEGVSYAFIWRITGLQPDEFTFAMFMMTGLASAWMLRLKESISWLGFVVISGVFVTAIALSLVRTIWVATVIMVVFALIARRLSWLTNPRVLVPLLAVLFFAADIASAFLNQFASVAALAENPFLRRAITFGTLDARMGAAEAFAAQLPNHWIGGFGYAASPWISQKFGGFNSLPINFSLHNAPLEFLLYFGVLGLLLFFLILWAAISRGHRAMKIGLLPMPTLAVLTAYISAMYLTGLSNGSVFLGFAFFFFLGALGSNLQTSSLSKPSEP